MAASVTQLVDAARFRIVREDSSELVARVTGHLGTGLGEIPNVSLTFGGWEHVNVARGFAAYLDQQSPAAEWFGVAAGNMHIGIGLGDMLAMAAHQGYFRLGAVQYRTVATGPDSVAEAVQLGFVATTAPGGAPVVFGLRGPQEHAQNAQCLVQVFAADRAAATAARDELEAHIRARDVYRGALLQFDTGDGRGNELVTFLTRPQMDATEVILPDGVLATIQAHVLRSAAHTSRLRELGQHLKRGLLLHGAPGTGKTHTVRYLLSQLDGVTAAVLSGRALTELLPAATALVRRLQPAVLILEDVDLIAEDRANMPGAVPLLFELLNRIDGIDPDADVTFVLTTNRVENLETALVDRPGRVDLAVEIARPDPAARERLLRLYAGPVPLDLPDPARLITATDGVTASFIREWVRRTVLAQLAAGTEDPVLDETSLRATLDELTHERHHLTGRLLGGAPAPAGAH